MAAKTWYEPLRERRAAAPPSRRRGRTAATAAAILEIVDADPPPLRVFLGAPPLEIARERYAERLATWEQWSSLSIDAQGD
jgi:hypothetical protein